MRIRVPRYTGITVELVNFMGDDASIARAARVSTLGSEQASPEAEIRGLLRYLMKNRHGSPFEHGAFTCLVGAPIGVWREHMRHRIGFSYNEESARYRVMPGLYYAPAKARIQEGKPGSYIYKDGTKEQTRIMHRQIESSTRVAHEAYHTMLNEGIAREQARWVLPVNTMSSAYVTFNPRSLMNFLSLRTHEPSATFPSHPMAEIEEVARGYEDIFAATFPITYEAFNDHGRVAP